MLDSGLTLAVLVVLAAIALVQDAERLQLLPSKNLLWGSDFHGGLWPAAAAILRGASPYPLARLHAVAQLPHAFYWPPPLAVFASPLAHLPYAPAIGIWNVVCIAFFVGGLRLFGLRDWRMYALALLSFPFQESLFWGQPEGIQLFLLALAWRYRESWRGGVALGGLVATKLIAWPMLIWTLVMRRYSAAWAAVAATLILLAVSWLLIDFQGMLDYPHLLSLDAHVGEHLPGSMSAVSLLIHLGLSAGAATLVSVMFGLGIGASAVALSGGSDEGWFSATVFAGLLWSPIMETHYLVVIFAPLCVSRRESVRPWLLTACFWVWIPSHNYYLRTLAFLLAAAALTLLAARRTGMARTQRDRSSWAVSRRSANAWAWWRMPDAREHPRL